MNPTLLNTFAIPLVALGCVALVRLRDRPGRTLPGQRVVTDVRAEHRATVSEGMAATR